MFPKHLHAFDTETTSDGKARVIATEENWSKITSIEDITNLLNPKSRGTIYESWNLGYDMRAILKWIPSDLWQAIYDGHRVIYEDHAYKALGNKRFQIGYPVGTQGRYIYATCLDMAAFYGYQRLNDAAQQYLNREKFDGGHWVDVVKSGRDIDTQLDYLSLHLGEVGEYCRLDSELTYELSKFMLENLEKIGVDTKSPISPANLAGKHMLTLNPWIRDMDKVPMEEFTRPTYRGGMFQALQRGRFDQPVYEYDISSAYPYHMHTLPDWRNGDFVVSRDEGDLWASEMGWVMAKFDCEYVPLPINWMDTIEMDYGDGQGFNDYGLGAKKLFYPSGSRVQPVTLIEAKWMREKGFDVQLMEGLTWNHTTDEHPPPFGYLADMFKDRIDIIDKHGKDDMRQYCLKLIMNSSYGKTAQSPDKYHYRAPTTDFGYASYVTALTRMQIAEAAFNHEDALIEIATDAVYLTEFAPELVTPDMKVLGTWERADYDGALWIGGGIKQLWKDGDFTTKARGFTNDRHFDLEKELRAVGDKGVYAHHKRRPLQLGEVLRAVNNPALFKPELLNTWANTGRRVRVNMDDKRNWEAFPLNWDNFLDHGPIKSKPWTIEEVSNGDWIR